MTLLFSRPGTFVLAAVVGLALTPAAFAQQQPAPSDQAVENEAVHGNEPDRHMAPHDTFYTMDYVSARTDKGVDGFPPGTEVKLVSVNREAHTLTVTDGHANIELPPDKLTNDMDIAAMVRAQDAASQERIARYQQAQAEAYQKYQKEVSDYTAKDLEKREEAIQQANEQRAEQVAENHTTQESAAISSSYNNGYYNQGGYGYGSPYSYFVDLNSPGQYYGKGTSGRTARQTAQAQANGSNGKGAISSAQNGTQSGNATTGGATSGTTSSTTSGGTGGGKAGGKP